MPILLQDDEFRCNYFLGYKNNILEYSFFYQDLAHLEKIYQSDIKIQDKMEQTLQRIKTSSQSVLDCTQTQGYRYKGKTNEFIETSLHLAIFGPFIPIAVVFGAGQLIGDFKELIFDSNLKKIKLGMSLKALNELLKKPFQTLKVEKYEIKQLVTRYRNYVFVFEQDQLVAFVWGSVKTPPPK